MAARRTFARRESERRVGTTVKVAVSFEPLNKAETTTFVFPATSLGVTVKFALALPAGIKILSDGTTDGVSLLSTILTPPLGARPFKRMVPFVAAPLATTGREKVMAASSGASPNVFESVLPSNVAVMTGA